MFEIGFMELVLVAIVSLLVVGPERLPGTIRTAALWIGRAKRSFNQVKADIEREINADEIRRQLHNESILADIEKAKKQADKLVEDARKGLDDINADVNSTLAKEKKELDEALQLQEKTPDADEASPAETPARPAPTDSKPDAPSAQEAEPVLRAESDSTPAATASGENGKPKTVLKPVEDFYNNPPSGIIQLKGGVFQQVVADEEEGDQEPQRKS